MAHFDLPDTLPGCLLRSAESEPDRGVTIVGESGTREFRTYHQLREAADRAAAALQIDGVEPLERVVLALPTGFEFLTTFFGALSAGIVPVPVPELAGEREERLRRMLVRTGRRLDAEMLVRPVGSGARNWPGEGWTSPFATVTDLGELLEDVPSNVTIREPTDLPSTAYVQMSEGTTASPRAVELTHENIVSNVSAIGGALQVEAEDVGVSWIPLHNPLGLIGVVCFGVAFGIDLVLIHPERFLARPYCWLEAISRYDGTLSAAPNFAYHYAARRCRESDLQNLDLSSWRVAMSGGEPVRGQHLEAFLDRLRDRGLREDVFTPVYGLVEATIGVTVGGLGESFEMDAVNRHILEQEGRAKPLTEQGPPTASERMHLVSVGTPIGGIDLRIVDEGGDPVGERVLGEVAVRGPNLMRGYVDGIDPRGAVRVERGWLYTGDLGYRVDERLYVVGRACDRIALEDGREVFPEEIEFVADAVDGVHAGHTAVFGCDSGELVVAFELQPGTAREDVVRSLERLLETHLAVRPDRLVALALRSIPRTKSGKVRRHFARRLYDRGRLDRRERSGRIARLERMFRRRRRDVEVLRDRMAESLAAWLTGEEPER